VKNAFFVFYAWFLFSDSFANYIDDRRFINVFAIAGHCLISFRYMNEKNAS